LTKQEKIKLIKQKQQIQKNILELRENIKKTKAVIKLLEGPSTPLKIASKLGNYKHLKKELINLEEKLFIEKKELKLYEVMNYSILNYTLNDALHYASVKYFTGDEKISLVYSKDNLLNVNLFGIVPFTAPIRIIYSIDPELRDFYIKMSIDESLKEGERQVNV
jgi:hypothetical protein